MRTPNEWMFKNKCAYCKTPISTLALDRSGALPKVFCDRVCESNFKNRDKFHVTDYKIIPNR